MLKRTRKRSEVVTRDAGDTWGLAFVTDQLGEVCRLDGDSDRAGTLIEASVALFRRHGERVGLSLALADLASLRFDRGDVRGAKERYGEALKVYRGLGERWFICRCLTGLVTVACAEHDFRRAARLLGVVEALLESISGFLYPADRADYDRVLVTVRAELDESGMADAWHEGRASKLEHAIRYALEADDPR